jgi:tRNA/rRNA methyltransferase
MGLESIRIVLARPLYGGNVGSVCRAMMNMGFSRLVLVEPRAGNDAELRKMAMHAIPIYDQREEYPTVAEAVADCGVVVGTTARMGLYRAHARTAREWAGPILEASGANQVAFVFGPEDRGLRNDEIALCTHIIQIPSTDAYASLNLAQAVMICCYELYVATGSFEPVEEKAGAAASEQRERMFRMWRETLLDIGFMEEPKADHMMHGLRRILSRDLLSSSDVKILMGIARQAQWCAKKAREAQNRPS